MNYEYLLIRGKYESRKSKVEIEDTKTREDRYNAIARLKTFKRYILVVGCTLQAVIVLAMLCTLAFVDCEGTSMNELISTIVVSLCMFAVMFGFIVYLMKLQSNTTLEGVPL